MCDQSYAWVPIQYLQYVLSLLWASLVQSRHRIGREIQHPVCVWCSFWGSADNPRPNLPAVFGHGLLLSVQSLMWSSTLLKVHKWDFNSCHMHSVCAVASRSVEFKDFILEYIWWDQNITGFTSYLIIQPWVPSASCRIWGRMCSAYSCLMDFVVPVCVFE